MLLLLVAVAAVLLARYLSHEGLPQDFRVFLKARALLVSGADPYLRTDPLPYKYSPAFLVLFDLLLPSLEVWAWRVFATVSVLAFVGAIGAGLWKDSDRGWKQVAGLAIGFVIAWKGILETLDYGQLELALFAVALVGAISLRAGRVGLGAFLLGTLPWVKLPWALLVIPLGLGVFREPRKLVRAGIGYVGAGLVLGVLVPWLRVGLERTAFLTRSWIDIMRIQPARHYVEDYNQSLWATLQRWEGVRVGASGALDPGPSQGLRWIWVAAVIAILGWMVQREGRRGRLGPVLWLTPWFAALNLLNPLAWRWGSVLLIGAPLLAQAQANAQAQGQESPWVQRGRLMAWVAVLLLWLLQQNPVVRALGYSSWTELHPHGSVMLYWLAVFVAVL